MKSIYFVTFRSVTFAQRGERVLRSSGIHCTLQRTPRWMEEQGCGYALRLRTNQITDAVEALRREKLPIRRVYQQYSSGDLEEVRL